MYLLDANACIRVINGWAPMVHRFQACRTSDLRLCSIVKAELIYGARRSAFPAENLRTLSRFFEPFVSLPFDDECAAAAGGIREHLARIGRPIAPNDLLIAAIALRNHLELVTHNVTEFSRVMGLRLADWEADP
jgi:tRNA(fMet)-specific endonuclease VapC